MNGPDIKTYLADASDNLKRIIPDAALIHFDVAGNVFLDGKFTIVDLNTISDRLAEVIARLDEIKKKQAIQEDTSK